MKIWRPTKTQEIALRSNADEILYGGARGGGKTEAGLMWLLYHIDNPKYRALVVRRNATDLQDWIDKAKQKYLPLGAKFKGQPVRIEFPSGAIIYTGHLKDKDAYTKYQGWEIHKILIEEATHIPSEENYENLLGSNRSTVPGIKPQVFLTTNPDGPGHYWLKHRFKIGEKKPYKAWETEDGLKRIYIPSRVYDNPHLVEADPRYVKYLESLPKTKRKQWLEGSWEDFDIEGAYYQHLMKQLEADGHILPLKPEKNLPTVTAWDLGMSDSTAIWIAQIHGNEIRIIDFYENSGQGLNHYINYLMEFKDKYGVIYTEHYAPHDIAVRELSSGKSRLEIAEKMGIRFEIAPNESIAEGIEAVRNVLPLCYFDKERCKQGIECLKNYRREWDEKLMRFKDKPLHDWTSHAADAFRYFALAYQQYNPNIRDYVKKSGKTPEISYPYSSGGGSWLGI